MKRNMIVALSIGLVAMLSGCSAQTVEPMAAKPLADLQVQAPSPGNLGALTQFGQDLFEQVRAGAPGGNPVISPLSVFYALGMAYEGAAGDTAAAFQRLLGVTAEQARDMAAYLLFDLADPGEGTTLTAADSAWLDDALTPRQDWVDAVASYYKATVYNTDLQAPSTLPAVNKWISDATHQLIPKMLEDPLGADVVALLINTLYMKAAWLAPFTTDQTHKAAFTMASGQQAQADFMSAEPMTRPYINTADAEGVVMPYTDGRLAFLAVMPKTAEFELSIPTLLAAASYQTVALTMPKFKTEFGMDLVPVLKALGLGPACEQSADFSGIGTTPTGDLFIDQVLHKVSMSVDENGTEAAAATIVSMAASSAALDWINLDFDHPFIYAVVDTVTGVPLFIGWMDDPS